MSGRYKSIQIFMHWMTVLLVIGLYSTIYLTDYVSFSTRNELRNIHFNFGVIVWIFMLIRFILHFKFKAPTIIPPLTKLIRVASKATHHTMYLLFLIQPIVGVLIRAYEGRSWSFLGIEITSFVNENEDFSYTLGDIHEVIGLIILAMIAIHALGAIVHHYIIKDNTLKRMLPYVR